MCLLPVGQTKLAAWLNSSPSTLKLAPEGIVEMVMLLSAVCARKAKPAKRKSVGRRNRFIDDTKQYIGNSTSHL